uniref:Uncharacterized protein n=1 Tax=Plectus sambesii TaxID=2011161 RepID=A0A914WBT0_9BILA
SQLQERTEAIENVNREGGKFIREAKGYDNRLGQYSTAVVDIHGPSIRSEFRRTTPQPLNGADQVTRELEELNRRFAQLSSFILERRNIIQVLIQNWKRSQQEDDERRRAEEEARRRAEEEARRRAAEEEAERLRRLREEEEARRRAAEAEADRLRRLREEEDARRRAAEAEAERLRREREAEEARRRAAEKVAADEAERERLRRLREAEDEAERLRRLREEEEARRRAEEEARRRAAEEDARRRAAEDARRKAEEEARRRAAEEEARRRAEEEARRRAEEEARRRAEEDRLRQKVQVDIRVGSVEPVVRQVETHRSRVHIPPSGVGDTAEIHVPLQEPPKLNIRNPDQLHTAFGEEDVGQFEELGDVHDRAKITEHEDEMNMYQEETVTNTQFYEMEAVLHKQTGEILTFVEAVRQGLLDLTSGAGEFYDIVSGSKISLEKAAELGYIDGGFNEALQTQYGIRHPETKENITLLDAIQIGLYDPDIRQLRDPHTGEILSMYECVSRGIISFDVQHRLIKMGILKLPPMPLEQAIEQGVINTETGQFTGKYTKETMPLKDALYNGYIQIASQQQTPMIAICLTDCIEKRFLNAHTGEFNDKNTKDTFTLRDAVSRQNNLLNLHVREVVNTADRVRMSLGDAVVRNAVNTRQGNFTDLQQRQSISLQEAYDKDLIQKPLTLTEIHRKDLIDSQGRFIDGGTKHRMTLVEAVANGLLDPEVRHIVDPEEKDVISIADALERGVLEPDGKMVDAQRQRTYTVAEAVREGLMVNRVRHSIFDVKGIKNTQTGATLSFNEAVNEGIVILQSERVVDLATQESFLLPDTAEKGLVDPMLHQLLSSPIGIKDRQGNELTVFRAVAQGIIDSSKAVFLDKSANQELSPKDAYEAGQITLRGALQLTALFDIHPSLVGTTKRVDARRRIRRPGGPAVPDLASDQVKVTLAEAMKQGLIDSRTQRFRQGDQDMSLQDALNQGLIDPSSEWIVPSKSAGVGPTIEEKTSESVTETSQQLAPKVYPDKNLEESVTTVKRLRTTETTAVGGPGGVSVYRAITGGKGSIEVPADGFHLLAAERQGLLDTSTGMVNPPNVDRSLTLEEAFDLGVINAKNITVRDPKSGRQMTANEAIEAGIMDKTGHITDSRGQRLNLQSAIENQVVSVEHEPPATIMSGAKKVIQFSSGAGPVMSFRPVGTATVEESEQSWTFDTSSGELVDQLTGERMSLDEAIRTERMPTDQLLVRDTLTGREMQYDEAAKWGIIDKERGYFTDKRDNRRYSMAEAAQQGRVYPTGGVPEHAGDAVHTSVKIQTKSQVMKKEALAAGPAAFVDYTLQKVVDLGWYNPENGMFTHPDTKKHMTLKEAIIKGLFNPYDTVVIDRRNNKELSLLDAIQADIVDAAAGVVTDTNTNKKLNLKEAAQQGILKSGMIPQTLETVITSGRLDLSTGQFTTEEGRQVPLNEAISKNQLDGNSIVVRDPATGDELAFVEAVRSKVVDCSRGLVMNKKTGEAMSFPQALTSGTLSPVGSRSTKHAIQPPQIQAPRLTEQKLQLTPYSQHSSQQQVSLREQKPTGAGRKELVDLGGGKQVMVKVVRSEDGLEKGEYVDPASGMKFTIQLHGDPYVTQTKTMVKSTAQVQSVELEPHAEFVGIDKVRDMRTDRVMSLKDAQRAGLARVDKKGKQMTKTYSVFRSDIYHALSEGVVDPSTNEKISLEDAIRAKIIDIRALTYLQPSTGDAQPFTQAANMGMMDVTLSEILPKGVCNPASGERIPITRAIELGIINPKTGEVFNPFTKEKLAWLDIVKPVYASLTMEGIYDPTKGYGVPVTSALNDGLIDTKSERYCNPITGEKVSLADASAKGLIDEETYKAIVKPCLVDYRTQKSLNLLQAVDAKLIDPRNRTFRLGENLVVPIARAMQEGKIPSEVGERLKRVDKWTFAEALGKGLIDVKSNQFTDPDSGRQMTIAQALEQGYIDTGSVEAMEGSEERNLTNVLESDEFDENSGRIRDRKTGLYLTFKQAIDKDVIDGDSLLHDIEAGQTMTIREAVNRGRVDNNGKYVDVQTNAKVNLKDATNAKVNLKDAVKSGLLALIASPMQAAQSVAEAVKRRDTEGYRFKIESSSGGSGGPDGSRRVRTEETTTIKLAPHRVEPTLSLRVRTDETRDRIRSLIDDPQAIADRQYEFLDSLEKQQFDTNEKLIQNPATGRPVSVREAAECGLLDVLTGEIVHPTSGRRYSIPRAVHMRMVDAEPAKRVMESLNLSLEELNSTIQTLSPTASSLSPVGGSGGGADSGSRSYTKVVSWHGQPSELRELRGSKADPLSPYALSSTKITEERRGGPQSADEPVNDANEEEETCAFVPEQFAARRALEDDAESSSFLL